MKTINEVKDKANKILGTISLKQLSEDENIRKELCEIIDSESLSIEEIENELNQIELFLLINNKMENAEENYSYLRDIANDLRNQKVRKADIGNGIPLFKVEKDGKNFYFLTRKKAHEFIDMNKELNLEIIEIEESENKRLKGLIEQIKEKF